MSSRWNNKVWDKISKEDLISLVNDLWVLSEKYEEQIHNAIEYIEKHKVRLHQWFDEPDCDYWLATNPDDILDILKGSDKEC